MKKACILSNGCPESMIDSARVKLCLEKNGWQSVEDPATADLTVFYSCALTNAVVDDSLNTIKELQKSAKHDSQVITWGCLPKLNPEALKQVYQGPTFSEDDLYKFDEIIDAGTTIDEITANQVCSRYQKSGGRERIFTLPLELYKLPSRIFDWFYNDLYKKINLYNAMDSSVYYIKTSTGCLGHCTYCAVRLSRGTVKSKSIDEIISEFREGLKQGYKNFALLGTDLCSFGRDLGYTLVELLREMVKEDVIPPAFLTTGFFRSCHHVFELKILCLCVQFRQEIICMRKVVAIIHGQKIITIQISLDDLSHSYTEAVDIDDIIISLLFIEPSLDVIEDVDVIFETLFQFLP